jgi:replicative DNA helicase
MNPAESLTYLEDRLPPCNIEAEEAIAGGVILDPNAIARIRHLLSPEDFYSGVYRQIFKTACEIYDAGNECNLFTVVTALTDAGRLEQVGGKRAIALLLESTVSAVNVDYLADLVASKSRLRKLIQIGRDIQQIAHQAKDYPTALNEAERLLSSLSMSSQSEVLPLSEIAIAHTAYLEEISLTGRSPGVPTGFYDLDAMTNGLQPGDLWILGARPSMGKTALALAIATNVAKGDRASLVFSLEMSKEAVFNRLLAAETDQQAGAIASGRIDWNVTSGGIARLSHLPFFLDDSFDTTIDSIRSKSRKLAAEVKDRGGLGCIVIDYLQIVSDESENRVAALSRMTRALKSLARELNTTVICLSQLSRGVESRSNKRPMMSDLRESGGLEQDADVVAMLYRDEYYTPDTADRGIVEISIVKQRNGPTGITRVLFEQEFSRFRNLKSFN